MHVVFLLFERITALDAVGPYEVLARMPGARVTFAAPTRGAVRTDNGALGLVADVSIDDVDACDLLVIPGGFGTRALERDERVLGWVRALDRGTTVTASVCTGALVLGAAGLLTGRRANTHWALRDRLAEYGATPVADRVVRDGKYATAAGVSAGIDLALTLAAEFAGRPAAEAIQLSIEYDPAPPFDRGNAARAPAALRDSIVERLRRRDAALADEHEAKTR